MKQDSQAPLAAGTVVGDYVIQRALGHDGQGYRYLADGPNGTCMLHELFPLQVVRRIGDGIEAINGGDRSALRWWTRSYLDRARAFAALRHPALASIESCFEAGGSAWHASRPDTGLPLAEALQRTGAIDATRVQRVLVDVLDALAEIHAAGLVHRAVGPQQIWLQDDGGALLRGFGSLRGPLRLHARTLHSVAVPPYAAPEEMQADAPVGPAADIYALAAVAWQLLARQAPPDAEHRGTTPSLPTLAGERCPAALVAAIERAFDPDSARRPQAREWRASLPISSSSPRRPMTVAPTPAPRRLPLGAIAASAAVIAGIAFGALWMLRAASPPTAAVSVAVPTAARPPPIADNRPRFVPASLAVEDGGPALNQDALARIRDEAPAAEAASIALAAPVSRSAPTPASAPTATPMTAAAIVTPPPPIVRPPPIERRAAASANEAPAAAPQPSTASIEVATLQPRVAATPSPEEIAEIQAAARARAHAQQLALERARCSRHVSELFADRDFTYADIAAFDDVIKLKDGRLQTPPMRTDDGRRMSFLLDRNGCIVRVVR